MKTQFLVHQGIYIAFNDKLMADVHRHQFIQINLLSPKAIVTVEQTFINASCLVIAANAHHALKSEAPVITILVDNFSVLGKKLTHLISCQNDTNNAYICFENVKSQHLWQYFMEHTGHFDYALGELLNSLLCEHTQASTIPDARIDKVLAHLNHNNADVSLKFLANLVNLSPSRLSHLLSEHLGMPFKSYLRYLRFQRLMPLLAGGYDLTTAAYEVGFSDSAHLSRECKTLFGIKPKLLKGRLTFEQV
ncbi:helix-turn-helix domain-containing protein [Pseudoalteromonas sp. SSM20]|uniref:helix-turn-helix domain-containing protein n=1 Tax=Pseudoalteromonas sp. SSM20 TaxID=3139394 RepID=UPI003BAB5DFB